MKVISKKNIFMCLKGKKQLMVLLFLMISGISVHAQIFKIDYTTVNPVEIAKFPKLGVVAEYIFTNYLVDENTLELSRRPDGWYVSKLVYEDEQWKSADLERFWDRKSGKYHKLKNYTEGSTDTEKLKTWLTEQSMEDWKYDPFYGYNGYDLDVIEAFGSIEQLPDTLLYALGRAYSNFADGFLRHQFMYRFQKSQTVGYEKVSGDVLRNYLFFANKELFCYEELINKNPSFQTVVGSIQNKLANEYMAIYMNLISIKEEALAQTYLKPGIYQSYYIEYAKNYLKACAPNAVLITNGDNDTFPLIYIQATEGFRSDVRVVNFTLSSADWYIYQLNEKFLGSAPIPLSLAADKYTSGTNDWVICSQTSTDSSINLKEVIQFIGSKKSEDKIKLQNGKLAAFLPSIHLKLEVDLQKVVSNGTIPAQLLDQNVIPVEWEVKKDHLYKNDLFLLDFLASNQWERPVYFVSPQSVSDFLDIEDYCYFEGNVYHFIPVKQGAGSTDDILIEKNWQMLMQEFQFGDLSDLLLYKDNQVVSFMKYYRNSFARLGSVLINNGENQKALESLDKGVALFPDEKVPFDMYMIGYGEMYLQLGENVKGLSILEKVTEKYSAEIDEYEHLNQKQKLLTKDEFNLDVEILTAINNLAEKYMLDALHIELDQKLEDIYKSEY
jgi:hypothetical protein